MYFHFSDSKATFERFATTVVETRYHGMSVDKTSIEEPEITPLLTKKVNLTLYRKIGAWDVVVGSVEAKQRLFGQLQLDYSFNSKYLNEEGIHNYALPPDLLDKKSVGQESESDVLQQLNKIADGFVTQLHFSLKQSMSPKDLLDLLETYNVSVVEMPIYSGEYSETMDDIGYSSDGHYLYFSPLKLRPILYYDEDNYLGGYISALNGEDVLEDSIKSFEEDLAWLLKQDGYYNDELDKKRMDYLRENEILAIGAVVTGPIREIEKLIEENDFHHLNIGGIEVWNWY